MSFTLRALLLSCCLIIGMTGCGLKGSLYLPDGKKEQRDIDEQNETTDNAAPADEQK